MGEVAVWRCRAQILEADCLYAEQLARLVCVAAVGGELCEVDGVGVGRWAALSAGDVWVAWVRKVGRSCGAGGCSAVSGVVMCRVAGLGRFM